MSESPSENEQDGVPEIKLPPKPLPEVESSFIRSERQQPTGADVRDRLAQYHEQWAAVRDENVPGEEV